MTISSSNPAAVSAAQISADEVVTRASTALFGKPLVLNVWRALLVESLIDLILPGEWTWCATDYAGWDFQHVDGTRLEVKQSAARQSWKATGRSRGARFDIAPRTGAWDGAGWITEAEPRRYADLYVLAHHPVADETADHRDPNQWVFHVVLTTRLPTTRSVSLETARRLAAPVGCAALAAMVEDTRISLRSVGNADLPLDHPWPERPDSEAARA